MTEKGQKNLIFKKEVLMAQGKEKTAKLRLSRRRKVTLPLNK